MDKIERKIIFKCLVGSYNYNLNNENSDKDYKIFVLPTFDDLYFKEMYSKSIIGKYEDYAIHDIRKLTNLFHNANVNFLEILFSEELIIPNDLSDNTKNLINEIFSMRNDLARMNLSYLYNSCTKMHVNKRNSVLKSTEGTQYLVDKFGYDTKQAQHSIRILDFLIRFADNNFSNFKQAIWYNDDEKELLSNIKEGKYSLEEYCDLCDKYFKKVENNYKYIYMNSCFQESTNNKLLEIIKMLVKENI